MILIKIISKINSFKMKKIISSLVVFILFVIVEGNKERPPLEEQKKMADFRSKIIRELGLDLKGKITRAQFYQFVFRTLTNDNKLEMSVVEKFKEITKVIVNNSPEVFDVRDIFKYMNAKSLESIMTEIENKKDSRKKDI